MATLADEPGKRIESLLADLQRGDWRSLQHLDAELLCSPLGLPLSGSGRDGLRHWSYALRRQLRHAATDDRTRRFCDESLGRLLLRAPAAERLSAAWHLRGHSRAADDLLRHHRVRLLDRGRADELLAWLDDDVDPRLQDACKTLLGLRAEERLPLHPSGEDLGPLIAATDENRAPPRWPWRRHGRTLARLVDSGQVDWQRLLPPDADLVLGPTEALILADDVRLWHADGSEELLPSGLRQADLIGIDGRFIWLWQDGQARAIDFTGQAQLSVSLPERPRQTPLQATSDRLLWLTTSYLVATTATAGESGRWQHGLDPAGTWQLWRRHGHILVTASDTTYRVSSFAAALHEAETDQRPVLWLRAERPQRALAAIDRLASTARIAPTIALLRRFPASGRTQDWRLLAQHMRPATLDAAWAGSRAGVAEAEDLVVRVAQRYPSARASWTTADGSERQISGAGFIAMRRDRPAQAAFDLRHLPAIGWIRRAGGQAYRIRGATRSSTVTCYAIDSGLELWRHRWPTEASLPSRSAAWRDGRLIVFEAGLRVHVIDPRLGDRLACYRPGRSLGLADDWTIVTENLAVVSGQDPRRFWLLRPQAEEGPTLPPVAIDLPATPRELVAEGAILRCTLDDGRQLRYRNDGRRLPLNPPGEP